MTGKLVLLGESAVGKSCIALRAIRNVFSEEQASTLGAAFMSHSISIDNREFRFDIWDTAGQERFSSIAPMYYRAAQFALVVYDVSRLHSFDRAKKWVNEVKTKSNTPNLIVCLVANKCDLPKDQWQVKSDEAQKYAKSDGLLFFEVSAKENINIIELFQQLAEMFLNKKSEIAEGPAKVAVNQNKPQKGCC